MEVWGLVEGRKNLAKTKWLSNRERSGRKYVQIAEFSYNAHSTKNIQTFPMRSNVRTLRINFRVVILVVKNNWGKSEFTSLYRFRIHGESEGIAT